MDNLSQTIQLQQIASNPKNSAWVFASAGSGKTKILTDRVLRLLLSDISPSKILCLTFTKVAASEMQNRINEELSKWVLCDDQTLHDKLKNIVGTAPSAREIKKARTLFVKILDDEFKIKVQTIHSFCQNIIKIFPFESNVKPNFEVLEQAKEKLLLKEAQKEILKEASADKANIYLKNLVTEINSSLNEESFYNLVSALLNKKEKLNLLKENFLGIEGVVSEIFSHFQISANDSEEEIFSKFLAKIDKNNLYLLVAALDETKLVNNVKISNNIKTFLQNPSLDNLPNYKKSFFTEKNTPRKVSKAIEEDENLREIINKQQSLVSEFFDSLNSIKICHNTALILRFVDKILENYSRLKNQNSFLDYNDLIVKTNELLENPDFSNWVKLKMDSNFDHILVDESQDTNHQQWNIIKALSEDFFSGLSANNKSRSIFVVGDEKQSIYSFQGAEPNISEEIFNYFFERNIENLHKIELNNSFRSLPEILNAVDVVFADEKRANSISKVNKIKPHQAIRTGTGHVEIWPQIKNAKPEKAENPFEWQLNFAENMAEENLQAKEILAEFIALKIRNWVENKRQLNSKSRPLKYGDFMILLRNQTNGFDKALMKFFQQYQVPFFSFSKIKFSQNLLIQDLLAGAKFALLPEDDLNLASLLKSPIFSISEEDLFDLCVIKNTDNISLFAAIAKDARFLQTKEKLEQLIKEAEELNCFEFFYFLISKNQENIIANFGAENAELLDKFILIVSDFYQNFSPNLQKFLEFIDKLDPEVSLSGDEDNRVKISTIHSAKGLQAPVVMIPDCCYNFNQLMATKEEISWINFSNNDFPIWCSKKSDENQLLSQHRAEKIALAKEEYLRLLYVAMTRAEDELYIGGFGNSSDPESWYEIAKNSLNSNAQLSEEDFAKWLETEKSQISQNKKKSVPGTLNKKLVPGTKGAWHHHQPQFNQRQSDLASIKGQLIHKILEIIGKNHREDKDWLLKLSQEIIEREEFFSQQDKENIFSEISNFISSKLFAEIFSGDIKCEAEMVGETEGKTTSVRIDLLVEKENEVLIIDYKSDETLPQKIPTSYYNQLKTYEQLVQKIYPKKKVSSAILWVKFLRLERLDN